MCVSACGMHVCGVVCVCGGGGGGRGVYGVWCRCLSVCERMQHVCVWCACVCVVGVLLFYIHFSQAS